VRVLEMLERLRAERGLSIVMITHDLGTLAGLAESISVLYRGRVVEQGPTARVLTRPTHPYTQLLVASVPTIDGRAASPERRRALREEVRGLAAAATP
jgi:ABC-type dipeptide/oligopeptide/nickel transport system ATPase component